MSVDADALAREYHVNKKFVDDWTEKVDKALKNNPQMKAAKERIAQIEGILMQFLDDTKQKNAGTRYGTIHTVTRYSAAVEDIGEFKSFVIENRAWDAIDWKANTTYTQTFTKEHQALPPGVKLTAHRRLSITAPKEPL